MVNTVLTIITTALISGLVAFFFANITTKKPIKDSIKDSIITHVREWHPCTMNDFIEKALKEHKSNCSGSQAIMKLEELQKSTETKFDELEKSTETKFNELEKNSLDKMKKILIAIYVQHGGNVNELDI